MHFQSHVDNRFKRSLSKTILDRAKRLSSTQDFFLQECKTLKGIFLKLKYPKKLIESAINSAQHPRDLNHTPADSPLRITLPYKEQKSADQLRRQLCDLGRKINHPLQGIFTSKKIIDDLSETELKPTLVNQQNVVYEFKCDLSDANYIGYVHVPSRPLTCRGTQSFRYWQAFLGKTQLRRKNLSTNFKDL